MDNLDIFQLLSFLTIFLKIGQRLLLQLLNHNLYSDILPRINSWGSSNRSISPMLDNLKQKRSFCLIAPVRGATTFRRQSRPNDTLSILYHCQDLICQAVKLFLISCIIKPYDFTMTSKKAIKHMLYVF